MGTRGFVGFVADKTEKIAYNHCDSNPSGRGSDVLAWLRFAVPDLGDPTGGIPELRERIRKLRVVDPTSTPTPADVEQLKEFADQGVSGGSLTEWYVLLRATQGNPGRMLAAGVIEDASDFPADSMSAEWGYVIDLDTQVFEVYQGFQKESHNRGRFAERTPHGKARGIPRYHPVALVAGWRLDELPSDEEFLKALGGES